MKEGRLAQDSAFSLPELGGLRVEAMFGVVDVGAPDTRPILINTKLSDGAWHRCFLDHAGFAVWERSLQLVDDDPAGDQVKHVDYGQDHRLIGEVVRSVEAKPHEAEALTQLTLTFESGRFVRLSFADPNDADSESRMTIGARPP